jgi:hypothetical protein
VGIQIVVNCLGEHGHQYLNQRVDAFCPLIDHSRSVGSDGLDYYHRDPYSVIHAVSTPSLVPKAPCVGLVLAT